MGHTGQRRESDGAEALANRLFPDPEAVGNAALDDAAKAKARLCRAAAIRARDRQSAASTRRPRAASQD